MQIRQIHEDESGRLWVQVVSRRPETSTVIEVLDLDAGKVIASATLEDWAGDPVGGGFYIKTYRELPTGESRIDIWGLRMRH